MKLTFSKLALAEACSYSLRPDVETPPGAPSAYADGGTAVHAALATLVNGGVLEVPEKPALRAMYAYGRAWLETQRLLGVRAEVAFAYDTATGTGRELADPPGEGKRWYADPALRAKYGVLETEVCGRVDLVAFGFNDDGGFVRVVDLKCHFGPEHTLARAQLEVSALAASLAYGVSRAEAIAVHLWEDREPEEERYELDAFDLDAIASDVGELAAAIPTAAPRIGPWCGERYCDARAVCPETLAAAESAVELIPAERLARGHSLREPIASNDAGAWTLTVIELLEELIKAKEADLRAFADAHDGITLPNGKVWSGQAQTKELVDLTVPGGVEALRELALDFAITPVSSWAAIRGVGGPRLEESARKALRAAGAVKTREDRVYMARAPKKGGTVHALPARRAS